MIEIKGIDHIVLRTDNVDAMLHFYRDVLCCEIERELADEVGLIQLRAGTALIDLVRVDSELGRIGGEAPSGKGHNMDHVCFVIRRLGEEELLDYLKQQGMAVQEFADRYGAEGFGRSIYIDDPDGNTIELKFEK